MCRVYSTVDPSSRLLVRKPQGQGVLGEGRVFLTGQTRQLHASERDRTRFEVSLAARNHPEGWTKRPPETNPRMEKGVRECENHLSRENRCRPGGGGWAGNWWLRSNLHSTLYTLPPINPTPYTPDPLPPTPYTLHPTPYSPWEDGMGFARPPKGAGWKLRGGSWGGGVRELNGLGFGGGIGMREEMYGAGSRVQSPGSRVQGPGSSVQCPVFRVQGPGSKIQFF